MRPRRSQDALPTMLKLKLDFGTILVGFSSQLGLQNRPKSSKNRGQDAFDFYVYFLMFFWLMFEGFLLPKRSQLGIKFIEKSTLTSKGQFSRKHIKTTVFSMFFRFSAIEVGRKNRTKINHKLNQKWSASWHRFFIDFVTNLARFWRSKSMKNRCQEASKRHLIFERFWDRFLMVLGCLLEANLPPTWSPRRAKTRQEPPRRRPKSKKNGAR